MLSSFDIFFLLYLFDVFCLIQQFPTGGSQPQSGLWRSGCGLADSSLNSLLKSQIFRTLYMNILFYISKTETRTDICEIHIISITIPI